MTRKIEKTDAEWRAQLSPEEYQVTRQKGTERAFTGRYWDCHEPGQYRCVCCGADLFSSEHKFDSGCGWPSFYETVNPDAVTLIEDRTHGMVRTEVRCRRCDSHLGHVFPDGYGTPTGDRYCMNSVSLTFEADGPADSAGT